MQRILILNSKGGCGKSTIATNLAGYYAQRGSSTALLDYDPQASTTQWLKMRSERLPSIHGVAAFKQRTDLTRTFQLRLQAQADRVIIDAPAGIMGVQLADYVARVDTILIPVLPSPIDIHATAHFIEALFTVGKARARGVNVAVLANRVRAQTLVYKNLRKFLTSLKLPFLTTLRDSQDYIRAAEQGMSIHEFPAPQYALSRKQWEPLLRWLDDLPERQSVPTFHNLFPAAARSL